MAYLNEIRLIGRLVADPTVRDRVSYFTLACSRKYMEKEETLFIDIVCFNKVKELVDKYLRKGQLVYCGGRLKIDYNYDSNPRRSKSSVILNELQFLEKKGSTNEIYGERLSKRV